MLKLLVSLILVIEAIQAQNANIAYICREPSCGEIDIPRVRIFPETEEELQVFCDSLLGWLRCQLRYVEGCEPYDVEEVSQVKRLVGTFEDICSEDTLLHAAIVDNLKCFSEFVHDDTGHCVMEEGNENVQNFAEALTNEGIISPLDNENDTTLHHCIEKLFFFACYSQKIENKCGTVAMEAYVKIVQSVGPGVFGISCEETFDQLPAVIDLRNLATDITEEVKKRK